MKLYKKEKNGNRTKITLLDFIKIKYKNSKINPPNPNDEFAKNIYATAAKCGEGLAVQVYSQVTENTYIGHHVAFNGIIMTGSGKITIGNYFHCGPECLILTHNHNYEGDGIPYDSTYIVKDTSISDFVWLGTRVMLLPGTEIGEGAIIQAGSVVHGKIPPYAIAGGNPAKVFKYRDIEHFNKMKKEGKLN